MFRTSCKVVQRNNKKRKSSYPKSTNYFLNQSTFEWLWNHVWLWKKKKKKETYVFISLFTWTFTVLQTSVKARPVREVALCIFSFYFFILFLKMLYPQRLLPNHRESSRRGLGGGGSAYSLEGWGVYGLGAHPLCQLALEWPCGPVPLPSGLSSDGTATMGGGGGCAVHPWCINQKALLSRALRSSALSPCLPRSTWGLPLPFGSFDM